MKCLFLLITGLLSLQVFTAHAYSIWTYCDGTSGTYLSLHNVTFRSDSLPSPGHVLYTSEPYHVSYTCSTQTEGPPYNFSPLLIRLGDIQPLIQALNDAGLGMNIILQEVGQAPVTWTWSEIKSSAFAYKRFGAQIPLDSTNVARSATLQFQLVVASQINRAQIVHVPSLTSFAIVNTTSGWARAVQLATGAFDIRYIPDNYGTVTVMPSSFALGHFYTTYGGEKSVSFSVTAAQRAGTSGPLGTFNIPLKATFTVNGKALTDAGQAVLLTNDAGQPNGLKLSVTDTDVGDNVTFGQPSPLGTLAVIGSGVPPVPIIKHYTARVGPVAGQTLKTGPFSADVVVTVTYD
ncbi:hypothetical protein ABN789_005018 [Salmonella enterica]